MFKRINKPRFLVFVIAVTGFAAFLIRGTPVWLIEKIPYFAQGKKEAQEKLDRSLQPQLGAPFALINQQGERTTSESLKGRYLLVQFGYTACPGICVINTNAMIAAVKKLGKNEGRVIPTFITFDPEHDKPARLLEYVQTYNYPRLLALTGNANDIQKLAAAYKVFYQKASYETKNPQDEDYIIDHSALIYLVGPEGNVLTVFAPHTDPEKMAQKITSYFS